MNRIIPFCGTDELRFRFMKPARIGGWVYATCSRIAVRVPAGEMPGVGEVEHYPSAVTALGWNHDSATFQRVELPPYVEQRGAECKQCAGAGNTAKCGECGGEGSLECDLGHEHECGLCGGEGTTPKGPDACDRCGGKGCMTIDQSVSILGALINAEFATKIDALGNVEWGGIARDALMFRSGTLQGLVMPMRVP